MDKKRPVMKAMAENAMQDSIQPWKEIPRDRTGCFGIESAEEVLFGEDGNFYGLNQDEVLPFPKAPRGSDVANVGPRRDFRDLEDELRFNQGKLQKLKRLAKDYSNWRPVRGDGNCYYRSIIFGALEAFLATGAQNRYERIMLALSQVRYRVPSLQDVHDQMLEVLRSFRSPDEVERWIAEDAVIDQALILACRRLVRDYLMKRADEASTDGRTYSQVVRDLGSSFKSIEDYCRQVIDPLGIDAETFSLHILPTLLGLGVRIWILDSRDDVALNKIDIDGPDKVVDVHLLFKPGQYDLLYAQGKNGTKHA